VRVIQEAAMKLVVAVGVLALLSVFPSKDVPRFTDWGPAESLGPVINSPYLESCVSLSKNGLSLFFSSNRQTGNPTSSDRDLYVSTRPRIDAPWQAPAPLGMLNTTAWESCPALSLDEHRLYFTSDRPGGCGQYDIWVSRRQHRTDDFSWQPPVNLGCKADGYVNSPVWDLMPTFFEDETGRMLMYFGSNRDEPRGFDLFQIEMTDDDTFGPAKPLSELNSAWVEHAVTVRRDGLEVIFASTRTDGRFRFWTATRASTADPWSEPVLVSSLPAGGGGRLALSFDGRELYFSLLGDLWVARRDRVR
jgi:hypothetical protein